MGESSMRSTIILATVTLGLAACSGKSPAPTADSGNASDGFESKLHQQLLDAKPGSVVEIPAGHYSLKRGLSLRTDGVTIRGAGKDKTVLSFKDQVTGPEGLLVNANDFTVEHLAIEDTKGDGLKINQGRNITIRDVRVEWTGGPKTTNGAYGIYPVKSKNVLIEDSASYGASDAGIYVGQSQNVIVRRNRAEKNVAGIEIENTINADVYENTATGNTGGILVFNMPNLAQPGQSTRVFKNTSIENNLANLAAKGAAVASGPAGSGVVVNSNSKVEIFDNDIGNNKTANLIISSYFSTNYYNTRGVDPKYDPYPRAVFVYGNRFKGGGDSPDGLELKTLKTAMFGINGHFPDVLWDGYVDSKSLVNGMPPAGERICVQNGNVEVLNADGPNKYKNPKGEKTAFQGELPKLAAVELPHA